MNNIRTSLLFFQPKVAFSEVYRNYLDSPDQRRTNEWLKSFIKANIFLFFFNSSLP